MAHLEIEHKFLIRKPAILADLEYKEMEQTYLLCQNGTARVRMIKSGGKKHFYFTHKKRINAAVCEETEGEITEKEYKLLLKGADPARKTICKTRYYYPYEGHVLEIDVYPFWRRQCVMEIELEQEGQEYALPAGIEIIRDVTAERAYKNFALAKAVPEEEI